MPSHGWLDNQGGSRCVAGGETADLEGGLEVGHRGARLRRDEVRLPFRQRRVARRGRHLHVHDTVISPWHTILSLAACNLQARACVNECSKRQTRHGW